MADKQRYPAIADYALISDSNSVALVSRGGSIDWCCIQRIDSGSCFGRLLDREEGGYCSISSREEDWTSSRRYVGDTLVLETTFYAGSGEVRVLDFFALPVEERHPYRQLIRIVEGIRGHVELDLKIVPRFDYGGIKPWLRQEGVRLYSAIGGNDGLLISFDMDAVIRAIVIYTFLLILFRITGRRSLMEATPFDFVLLLIIAETTQQGLLGNDFSVTNTFLLVTTLLGIDVALGLLTSRWRAFDRLMNDAPLVLVEDGRVIDDRLKQTRITEEDIMESARKNQGLKGMEQIKYAVLERSGAISVIPR